MDDREIRLRCIEAAKGLAPIGPKQVVDAAEQFYKFVNQAAETVKRTLGLPKKE